MNKIKLLVAGGRNYSNSVELAKELDRLCLVFGTPKEIVSGACPTGADRLGEAWAEQKFISIKRFPANWNKHGKAAGPIRNKEMAAYCDRAIVFWDGESRGSKNMIEELQKASKPVTIIFY